MPSSDRETTLARQWELLRNHLPARPPGRASRDLRDRLENAGHTVTKRTIERDMEELSRIFPIVRNEVSIPYGWHWKENAQVDIAGMDLSEAVSLGLLEDVLRLIMPPAFLSALEGKFSLAREKLAALPKVPHARWADLVRYVPPGLPCTPPAMAPGVLPAIQEALLRQRQLLVVYRSSGSVTATERILNPLAFIQLGERSYLVAGDGDIPEPKFFALHRMQKAEVLEKNVQGRDGFSLDEYLQKGSAQFGAGNLICLRARIHERLKLHFEESPIAADQKLSEENGEWHVAATLRDTLQLEFWILSWSFYIEVLEPVELRERIQSLMRKALDGYGPS